MSSSTTHLYPLKPITFFQTPTHILLQNANGPCPLLSLANALILRRTITLPNRNISTCVISFDELVELLANIAIDLPSSANNATDLEALLKLLPSMARGLDVNVTFTNGVDGYEFTEEVGVFDLFGIPLTHG